MFRREGERDPLLWFGGDKSYMLFVSHDVTDSLLEPSYMKLEVKKSEAFPGRERLLFWKTKINQENFKMGMDEIAIDSEEGTILLDDVISIEFEYLVWDRLNLPSRTRAVRRSDDADMPPDLVWSERYGQLGERELPLKVALRIESELEDVRRCIISLRRMNPSRWNEEAERLEG